MPEYVVYGKFGGDASRAGEFGNWEGDFPSGAYAKPLSGEKETLFYGLDGSQIGKFVYSGADDLDTVISVLDALYAFDFRKFFETVQGGKGEVDFIAEEDQLNEIKETFGNSIQVGTVEEFRAKKK